MPNAQILIIHNKGHAPGYTVDGIDYAQRFLEHPYKKLISQSKSLVIEWNNGLNAGIWKITLFFLLITAKSIYVARHLCRFLKHN